MNFLLLLFFLLLRISFVFLLEISFLAFWHGETRVTRVWLLVVPTGVVFFCCS